MSIPDCSSLAPFAWLDLTDFYTRITFMSTNPAGLSDLSRLFHHRWSVPVLSELARTDGSRFVNLSRRLGIGRDSLRRTLAWLIEQGLAERNPGYGHPLRPEYLLTARGRALAPACTALMRALDDLDVEDVGLNKWSMPVVAALDGAGETRFGQLRGRLPAVSPRALTLALKALADAGLVERRVVDSFPPTTLYALAARARPISRPLRLMAAA
jgi:DNA-binding HxlR family transcriptional regulator